MKRAFWLTDDERDHLIGVLQEGADDLADRIDDGEYDHDDPPAGLAEENLAKTLSLLKTLEGEPRMNGWG